MGVQGWQRSKPSSKKPVGAEGDILLLSALSSLLRPLLFFLLCSPCSFLLVFVTPLDKALVMPLLAFLCLPSLDTARRRCFPRTAVLSHAHPQSTRPPPRLSGRCSRCAHATCHQARSTTPQGHAHVHPPPPHVATGQASAARTRRGWAARGSMGRMVCPSTATVRPSHWTPKQTTPVSMHTLCLRCLCPWRAVQTFVQKNTSTHSTLPLFLHTPLHHRQLRLSSFLRVLRACLPSPRTSQPPGRAGREPRHTRTPTTTRQQPWSASMSGLKRK